MSNRNPLNDAETFAAICAGAGFAFGVAACLTLGSELTGDFAKLSLIALAVSAMIHTVLHLTDKLEDTKNSSPTTTNRPELESCTNQMDCNVILTSDPAVCQDLKEDL